MVLRENISVLIVDDVEAMRVQVRELLRSMGFKKIRGAGSGAEAKQALEMSEYHLVIVDWHMEPTDGLELLQFCRTNHKFRAIPMIMLTADSTKENVIQAISYGVDDYVIKPLTTLQIESKICGVLVKKGLL